MRTIAQLRTKITSRLHGTTLNKVGDFYSICEDAAEMMLARIDPVETTRKASLTNPVYDNVYDYALPDDLKNLTDLTPQANADNVDNSSLNMTFTREFVNRKKDNQFAVVWRDSVRFLRFSRFLKAPVVIDPADSPTNNGTWTVGGNASNLELDTYNYVAGSGSLKCNVSSPGALVDVTIRIGSDSSNYFSKTVTAGHFEAFKAGWNLLRFDFATATETGTVDMSAIGYIRVTTTYNTVQTAYYEKTLTQTVDLSENYESDGSVFLYQYFDSITSLTLLRLDNIVASIGTLFDVTYVSNYLFRSSAGVWKAKPTAETDIINLSPLSYKIFEAEVSRAITQVIQGAMGVFDYTYWNNMLEGADGTGENTGLYADYATKNPSERLDGSTTYYVTGDINTGMGAYPNIDQDE